MPVGKLLSIKFSNFGPFAATASFSTVADIAKKEKLQDNTFIVNDFKCIKVTYIFGANGVGKSNIGKGILQLKNILSLSPILASNHPQILEMSVLGCKIVDFDNPFKFNKANADKPTHFEIEMFIDGVIFTYAFDIKHGKILFEQLTKKKRRTETILIRTSPSFGDIKLKSELKSFENNVSVVKENVLCLSMAAFLNNETADKIMQFINSIEVVNMASMKLNHITRETCTVENIRKYVKILQRFADPTLLDIHVDFNEKEIEKSKMTVPDLEDRELVVRSVKLDIASTHKVYDSHNQIVESSKLPFLQIESNGTIKLFGILPVIFNVLEKGGVLFVDEIENGLHPNIVKQIIALFISEETNPLHAQLICTTHCKELIESKVRRDQVWIISKNDRGESSILRVSDIPGIRAYENNGSKYIDSAFGSMPANIFEF